MAACCVLLHISTHDWQCKWQPAWMAHGSAGSTRTAGHSWQAACSRCSLPANQVFGANLRVISRRERITNLPSLRLLHLKTSPWECGRMGNTSFTQLPGSPGVEEGQGKSRSSYPDDNEHKIADEHCCIFCSFFKVTCHTLWKCDGKNPEMLWHPFDLQPIMDSKSLTQKNMPYRDKGSHVIPKSRYLREYWHCDLFLRNKCQCCLNGVLNTFGHSSSLTQG